MKSILNESLRAHGNILIPRNNRQLLANITSLIAALESQKITILATILVLHTWQNKSFETAI